MRGALETYNRHSTASLLIPYFADRWRWNVRGSVGQANANGPTARTYGYLEAGGSYEIRADGSGVALDVRTAAAPAAVVVEAWMPIRGRKGR